MKNFLIVFLLVGLAASSLIANSQATPTTQKQFDKQLSELNKTLKVYEKLDCKDKKFEEIRTKFATQIEEFSKTFDNLDMNVPDYMKDALNALTFIHAATAAADKQNECLLEAFPPENKNLNSTM
jgi:hypothetical protein